MSQEIENGRLCLYSLRQTRECLGEFESLCEPEPKARIYISTFKFEGLHQVI